MLYKIILFGFVSAACAENWRILKNFDFSSMAAVRNDWNVIKWDPGFVNHERQAYVDNPRNIFIQNNNLVLNAQETTAQCQAPQMNIDIQGNDLAHVSGPISSCCSACAMKQGCVAYSWSGFNGGTCWLKSSPGPMIMNANIQSSALIAGATCSASQQDMDVGGNVLQQYNGREETDCCGLCYRTAGCKAYSWNNYLGGTCWMKDATGLFASAGVKAALLVQYASGRLESKARFTPTNVTGNKLRVEFTAKVPTIEGAWPALWMLGIEGVYGSWPQEGEIDLMEWVYQVGDKFLSSLHWKGPVDWSTEFMVNRTYLASDFHTYGVEYSSVANNEYIQYYFITADGRQINGTRATPPVWTGTYPQCSSFTPGASRCSPLAPFDNQMFLILNIAIGGDWGGCCGVSDYSAFVHGVKMPVRSVKVFQLA